MFIETVGIVGSTVMMAGGATGAYRATKKLFDKDYRWLDLTSYNSDFVNCARDGFLLALSTGVLAVGALWADAAWRSTGIGDVKKEVAHCQPTKVFTGSAKEPSSAFAVDMNLPESGFNLGPYTLPNGLGFVKEVRVGLDKTRVIDLPLGKNQPLIVNIGRPGDQVKALALPAQ